VVNLAGSSQVAPTYYLNPDNGVSIHRDADAQYQIDSLGALADAADHGARRGPGADLAASPTSSAARSSAVVSQYDIHPWCRSSRPRRP